MRRTLWMLLTALLLVVVIGDFLVWHFTVQRMQSGFAGWAAARRAAGWSVTAGATVAGGWPLAATLTVPDLVLQGGAPDIPDGLTWRTEHLVLRLEALHPRVLRIEAEGAQHLRLSDSPDIPYSASDQHLLVPLQADPSAQPLHLLATGLRASIPVAGGTDTITIDRLDVDAVLRPTAARGQPALSVKLRAEGVGLPSRVNWPLGRQITSVDLDGALDGPLPAVVGLKAHAVAWRDGGGSLEVRRFETRWGPLELTGTATLVLDPELQPTGTGSAHVTGYAETLDVLARNGVMSRSAATTAKAVLSLLADTPENGGPPEVEVPLSLQYRTLSMHQVPLVRLPELDLPAP
jgi:hypothetical protein